MERDLIELGRWDVRATPIEDPGRAMPPPINWQIERTTDGAKRAEAGMGETLGKVGKAIVTVGDACGVVCKTMIGGELDYEELKTVQESNPSPQIRCDLTGCIVSTTIGRVGPGCSVSTEVGPHPDD
jgi:hypothetical protein